MHFNIHKCYLDSVEERSIPIHRDIPEEEFDYDKYFEKLCSEEAARDDSQFERATESHAETLAASDEQGETASAANSDRSKTGEKHHQQTTKPKIPEPDLTEEYDHLH